ncbi:MAG: hypothetical protein JNL32_12640 [Candidatus Kapabacteria bacterium]|nr:hypothetical protein [Candidatus Kapabacteria bacterium]
MSAHQSATADNLRSGIIAFLQWLERNGYSSYDPYNLWSTRYGIAVKALYQSNKLLGLPAIAPIILGDIFAPRLTRIFSRKHRFPISDAHCIISFCTLYRMSGHQAFLDEAITLGEELLEQSLSASYSGHCWGYPFDWQTNQGVWRGATPLITTTPYCFEAYCALFDATHDARYKTICESIVKFAEKDLNETVIDHRSSSCSYSPIDSTLVVNANAYRSFLFMEAQNRFGSKRLRSKAICNLNFICDAQREDGSWWYALSSPSDAFIDNFHTCLVLKNLIKANIHLQSPDVWKSIERGYAYYQNHLFDSTGEPIPFATLQRANPVTREMYDYAEGINLGVLLTQFFPAELDTTGVRTTARATSLRLASTILNDYQLPDGHFITKVNLKHIPNTVPYIRWAQSQILHALTRLLEYETATQPKQAFSYQDRSEVELPLH